MKQKTFNILGLASAAFIFISCSSGSQTEQSAGSEPQRKEMVRVMELQPQTVSRTVEYPATLEANEVVHLAPASPGRIEKIHAEIGDKVANGARLVEMDRTQLRQAEIQLKNLEIDIRRLDTLAQYGSIAQQQFDQLKTQFEVAKSNVEFLQENVSLHAPYSGVITGRYFEPGEMYSGAPNTPSGKAAVISLAQFDMLKAVVALSEGYFPNIKKGIETDVNIDIYPNRSVKGTINRIHPTIDPVNRTFNVEVMINNKEGLLRPGMFVRIGLNMEPVETVLLPSVAVLKLQGSNERYLFIDDNGTARRISVTLGERYNDQVQVFSDQLQVGDRVIVTGQSRLLDGVPIEVVN